MTDRNDLTDTRRTEPRRQERDGPIRAVRLAIHGLGCRHCSEVVRQALLELPGVETVDIDLYQSAGTVRYDPSRVGVEDLLVTVQQAGEGGAHRYWADPAAASSRG